MKFPYLSIFFAVVIACLFYVILDDQSEQVIVKPNDRFVFRGNKTMPKKIQYQNFEMEFFNLVCDSLVITYNKTCQEPN